MAKQQALTEYDKEHGAENRLQASADFDGPIKNRRCTDVFCFLLLFCTWVAALAVGIWALNNGGDPALLIFPTDYKGRLCGDHSSTTTAWVPDILYYNESILPDQLQYDESNNTSIENQNYSLPPQWYIVDILFNGVCINGCPNETNLNPTDITELICKQVDDIKNLTQCTMPDGTLLPDPHGLVACGACMYVLKSKAYIDRCVPSDANDVEEAWDIINNTASMLGYGDILGGASDAVSSVTSVLTRFANDIHTSSDLILTMGFAGSTFLGFLILFILRIPGLLGLLVWCCTLITPALIAVGGGFCYFYAAEVIGDKASNYISGSDLELALEITAYVLWGIAGLIVCLLIFLRKRINLAVGITKCAAHAVTDLPFSVFYPLIQVAGYVVLIVVWTIICLYLASMREGEWTSVTLVDTITLYFVQWNYQNSVIYAAFFMLFVLFWSSEFILAMGQLTLSINFCKWYFTAERGGGIRTNLVSSMCIATFKHAGTAAFGALLIAIVKWIRVVVMYIYKKLKSAGLDNPAIKALMCCCQCLLCCVERCLKFINKNAYIQTALFGYSFCKAAREAFFLILRNAARMFALGLVSQLAVIFCKLFVVFGIGVSSFFALEMLYGDNLWSPVGISVFISIIAWFIANMFLDVVGIAISTILQCFIADEEMYPQGSYFVPDELDSFLKKVQVKE